MYVYVRALHVCGSARVNFHGLLCTLVRLLAMPRPRLGFYSSRADTDSACCVCACACFT